MNDVGFVVTGRGPVILSLYCERPADTLAGEQIVGDLSRAVLAAIA